VSSVRQSFCFLFLFIFYFGFRAAFAHSLNTWVSYRVVSYTVKAERPVFAAVKCDWFAPFDAVERGRSFVASGVGGDIVEGVVVPPGDDAAHRNGLVSGDNIKRSRDYRTSSRSNVTTSAAAGGASTSTPLLRPLATGRTSWIASLLSSPSLCLCLIAAVASRCCGSCWLRCEPWLLTITSRPINFHELVAGWCDFDVFAI